MDDNINYQLNNYPIKKNSNEYMCELRKTEYKITCTNAIQIYFMIT